MVAAALTTALTAACSTGPHLVVSARLPQAVHRIAVLSRGAERRPPYPLDVVAPHDAACARIPLARGWVARENALRGTPRWRPASHGGVQLYVDDPSLACGDRLTVRLGGTGARAARVRVVRLGWYGGAGAREVWRSAPVDVPASPEPGPRDHVVPDAAWPTTVSTDVGPTWVPGLYLAETLSRGSVAGAAAFVVRNDAVPSPLAVVDSNLTWAAYSQAGGASLYRGPTRRGATHAATVGARAWSVSLLRPTTGSGLKQLLAYDVPLAQLTDRLGLAADHVLDTDLELRPSVLRGHAGVVLPGHAEYWTRRGYDALQSLEDAGVNVADLGANALYWQARVSHDVSGRPLATSVFRDLTRDPVAARTPDLATVRWQDRPLSRPPSAVVGEAYAAAFARGGLVLRHPPAWLVAGSGGGDGLVLPGVVLNEADGARAQDPAAPAEVQVVAEGVLLGTQPVVVSTSYATLPSGAAVFDAGSTTWLCALTDVCPEGHVSPAASQVLLGITANVLRGFGTLRWGASHPAHRSVPTSPAQLLPDLPAAAIGRHGAGS